MPLFDPETAFADIDRLVVDGLALLGVDTGFVKELSPRRRVVFVLRAAEAFLVEPTSAACARLVHVVREAGGTASAALVDAALRTVPRRPRTARRGERSVNRRRS